MKPNSELNKILTGLMDTNESTNYSRLEDINEFKEFFCYYLQKVKRVSDDDLDESFRRWCDQLSRGRAPSEVRRNVVFSLWIHCNLKQVHIARLVGVSTRTIRRDMRALHKEFGQSGHQF